MRACTRWFLPILSLVLAASGVKADIIIMKDGFLLHGKVRQDKEIYVDPLSLTPVVIPRGYYFLDDNVRIISFSYSQLGDTDKKDLESDAEVVKLEHRLPRGTAEKIPPLLDVEGAEAWSDKWERQFRFNSPAGRYTIKQRLSLLTPYYARVDAYHYNWTAYYLTSELGADAVRALLYQHADLKLKGDKDDAARRFRIFHFLLQAGWYDHADQELYNLLRDMPGEKEKVEQAREHLARLRAMQLYDDIERGYKAGQHRWVQRVLADFPTQGVDEKLLAGVRALKAKYESANENLKTARRLLRELPPLVPTMTQRTLFTEAAAVIDEELSLDDFFPEANQDRVKKAQFKTQRLDSFLTLAQQADRERQQGRTPTNGPVQLLSLAVTGWLSGRDSAEPKPEAATRLWEARRFVLEYQNTDLAGTRDRLLRSYQANRTQALAFDELANLINFLPPPEPEKDITTDPVSLDTSLSGGRKRGATYVLQLPPEYRHSRAYPVLIALHQAGEKPSDMIDRFGKLAAQYGYILAVPEWQSAVGGAYSYSPQEHASVTEVLRDLRRRFQVDSDRVFLTGFGEGGNMAFDVGLSHPDLFAGVLPVAGQPSWYGPRYWPNAQYLPFYVVNGDFAGDVTKFNRKQFDRWVPRGYPVLHVEYKGRGQEWFEGEMQSMFDWMERKVRSHAIPELGKGGGPLGEEFQTLRPTDNHFYWLSSEGISDRNVTDPENWDKRVVAATWDGRIIGGETNQVNVNVHGMKQVTLWFSLDMRGLLDFAKPLTLRVNGTMYNRRIQPNVETLLEDFWFRGDRQWLFLGRIDIDRL